MPFQSEKQRRYLHANHPEIAKRWERDYANGGILDINENEEIISDDGNDIELTAFNAAFDDSNDLSTGVKTLFRAKNGGTPQLAKKSKDGTRPGYRGSDWASDNQNDDQGETSSDSGWSPGAGSPGTTSTGGNVNTGGGDQEDDVAQMMSNMNITPDHSPNYTGSDAGWVVSEEEQTQIGGADYIAPKDKVRIHEEILNRKKKYDSPLEQGKRAFNLYRSVPKTSTGIPLVDLALFGIFAFQQNKKKNERIAQIDEDLALLNKIGAPKHHHSVDTLYQKLTQEKLDLTQPRSRDEDTGGDGPKIPQVVPIGEEIEAYEGTYAMSPWDRIKANQAKRALLVEKGIIQEDSPIVDESLTDITMQANSGGLANLFRVKNQ